jgi:hypothetical protein
MPKRTETEYDHAMRVRFVREVLDVLYQLATTLDPQVLDALIDAHKRAQASTVSKCCAPHCN